MDPTATTDLLEETERVLRSKLQVYSAHIRPTAWRDGSM
jgi:hypothetical protein